jgi:hypothetical protein
MKKHNLQLDYWLDQYTVSIDISWSLSNALDELHEFHTKVIYPKEITKEQFLKTKKGNNSNWKEFQRLLKETD